MIEKDRIKYYSNLNERGVEIVDSGILLWRNGARYAELTALSSWLGLELLDSQTYIRLSDEGGIWLGGGVTARELVVFGDLEVRGTKSRRVNTDNYSERLQYCYETPTPLFGDIGEALLDEEGVCYVDIDDIFTETIAERCEYQVFLQAEGEGTCYIAGKTPRYFVLKGTPNLRVAWELKAKQRDYENIRLEQAEIGLEEYSMNSSDDQLMESFINEQEALLYDY